ncbi:MAG: TraX family protein [Tissierellia bacterium]|nr:TraX family protein [Tissierellia bacterium]
MSFFTVKLIAMIAMLIDHLGLFWDLSMKLSVQKVFWLRAIGRIALPLFAFNIVNGWQHSSSRENYRNRIINFMAISQIPYNLAFYAGNYYTYLAKSDFFKINIEIDHKFLILSIVFLLFNSVNKKTTIGLIAATIFTFIDIRSQNNFYFTYHNYLNVFYTLGAAIYIIDDLDYFKFLRNGESITGFNDIIRAINIFVTAFLFCYYSDYSFRGLLLIIVLYLLKDHKNLMLGTIAIWLFIMYYDPKPYFLLISLISVLILYLYNGKKGNAGKSFRMICYYFYPVHLFIIGLLVLFKLF